MFHSIFGGSNNEGQPELKYGRWKGKQGRTEGIAKEKQYLTRSQYVF